MNYAYSCRKDDSKKRKASEYPRCSCRSKEEVKRKISDMVTLEVMNATYKIGKAITSEASKVR